MKRTILILTTAAASALCISCGAGKSIKYPSYPYNPAVATYGTDGEDTGVIIDDTHSSQNSFDLVPIGNRITYTIDYGTPEGRQKLQGLTVKEATDLVAIEATRKYNCDSFIKQRITYKLSPDRECILRITLDGRPGNYKTQYNKQ